jgi:hypothetical protein
LKATARRTETSVEKVAGVNQQRRVTTIRTVQPRRQTLNVQKGIALDIVMLQLTWNKALVAFSEMTGDLSRKADTRGWAPKALI